MKLLRYPITLILTLSLMPINVRAADEDEDELTTIEQQEPSWREILAKQKKDKTDFRLFVARGLLQQEEGEYKDAINQYDKALKYNPKSTQALIQTAYCQDKLGKPVDAVTSLRKALRTDEKNADAHYLLGYLYVKQYRLSAAKEQINVLKPLDEEKAAELQSVLDKKQALLDSLKKPADGS